MQPTKPFDAACTWLSTRDIPYKVTIRESGVLGLAVSPANSHDVITMLSHLGPTLAENKARANSYEAGSVLTVVFANQNESTSLIESLVEQSIPSKLRQEIAAALSTVDEDQYRYSTGALSKDMEGLRKLGQRKKPGKRTVNVDVSDSGVTHEGRRRNQRFSYRLAEALDGIGADYQPDDILNRLHQAMGKMGLLDKLRAAGITARVTSDRQFVTFQKEAGGVPVKLVQVAIQAIADPKELEQQLYRLLDVASGNAPGAGEQQREMLKAAEKTVGDVASMFAAQQPEPTAQQQMAQADRVPTPAMPPVAQ